MAIPSQTSESESEYLLLLVILGLTALDGGAFLIRDGRFALASRRSGYLPGGAVDRLVAAPVTPLKVGLFETAPQAAMLELLTRGAPEGWEATVSARVTVALLEHGQVEA